MLTLTDIGIIISRLLLETISFYNAKMMYSYATRISPLLTLYITHSFGTLLFLYDLVKHKKKYLKKVYKDTGISPYIFFFHVAYLSLFYNLCHIPKFYAMNCLGDVSIVTIYGASVLCTYVFSIFIMNTAVDTMGIVALGAGVLGMFLLLIGDLSLKTYYVLCSWVIASSVFSGLYGVLYKLAMRVNEPDKKKEKSQTKNDTIASKSKTTNYNVDNHVYINKIHTKSIIRLKFDKLKLSPSKKRNELVEKSSKFIEITKDTPTVPNITQDILKTSDNIDELGGKNVQLDFYENETQADASAETSSGQIVNKSLKVEKSSTNKHDKIDVKKMVKSLNEKNGLQPCTKIFKRSKKTKKSVLKKALGKESKRKLLFMRHYMSLTGLFTFLFYWPGLFFVKYYLNEEMNFPVGKPMPLLHLGIAAIVSVCHNLVYFLIVAARTPLFAQVSGIILQPTFLFISLIKNRGLSQVYALIGCCLTFASYIILGDRH